MCEHRVLSIRSSIPGGYYESWNGTSMATPHVAALAAMVKLANPSYSPAKVESTIKSHCKDLGSKGWDQYYGYGIPNFANVGGGKTIAVTKVSLNKTSVTVKRGSKYTLKATVSPEQCDQQKGHLEQCKSECGIGKQQRRGARKTIRYCDDHSENVKWKESNV